MATTYANGYVNTAYKGGSGELCVLDVSHEITTGELATADVIIFGKVPAGAIYVGGYIATDDLDSATSLDLDVGDSGDADGLAGTGSIGQAAAVNTFAGVYITEAETTTQEENISVTVTAGAGTPVAGTVRVVLYYRTP